MAKYQVSKHVHSTKCVRKLASRYEGTWGSGDITPLIFNISTGWSCDVSYTPQCSGVHCLGDRGQMWMLRRVESNPAGSPSAIPASTAWSLCLWNMGLQIYLAKGHTHNWGLVRGPRVGKSRAVHLTS